MKCNALLGESINNIKKAIKELQNGKFVLIHDSDLREDETDFIMASEYVSPNSIKTMRKYGGGLIFLMISHDIAEKFDLPYLTDLYKTNQQKYPILKSLIANDIPYDTKSSFSLYINHRNTYTGITDIDRSLTIKEFSQISKKVKELKKNESINVLGKNFRTPGHIPICISSKNLLSDRFGHTELTIALLMMADLIAVGSGCEIMGDDGKALSKEKAIEYAKENNLIFLEGEEIIKAWQKWLK
jgi:3,4-dihydroxy 2-butanone 4-phosphate synthase